MVTRGVSAWSSEGQHRFRHREIKRCRHLDVGGSSVQHLHRPSEPLVEGGVIGDSPPMGLRLGMPTAQLLHLKSLRRLGSPELRAQWRLGDQSLIIHTFDRVGDGGRSDQRHPRLHHLRAPIKQRGLGKTTGSIVNQHMFSFVRETVQPTQHGLLPGASALDPDHRLGGIRCHGQDVDPIDLLTDDADPGDPLSGEGSPERPLDHRPPRQRQQQLVAISPHAATAACGGDQQMHKRLLPRTGGNDLHTISTEASSGSSMRVLALSPGPLLDQIERLPALATICTELGATLQVACDLSCRAAWDLIPPVEKVIPIGFDANPTLADWTNLLGSVREPDFQICLNFVTGRQVNLMLSMSHIPTRIGASGFAATSQVTNAEGWSAQQLSSWLQPLGLNLDADRFRLALPGADLDAMRASHPSGDGPLLLLAPSGERTDWPTEQWDALPGVIRSRLDSLRCMTLAADQPLKRRAAAVACADVVLTSCPITQLLCAYCGVPSVALGAAVGSLPERPELRCIGTSDELHNLGQDAVLNALGF